MMGTKPAGMSKRNRGVSIEFVDEFASGDAVDDGKLFDEPPPLTNPIKGEFIQRCSGFNTSSFDQGAVCGGPPSEPCFNRSRCQAEGGPKIYVYDQEVCVSNDGWNIQPQPSDNLFVADVIVLCIKPSFFAETQSRK